MILGKNRYSGLRSFIACWQFISFFAKKNNPCISEQKDKSSDCTILTQPGQAGTIQGNGSA